MTTDRTGLEVFVKQPLGGVEHRAILPILAENGLRVAREDLAAQRKKLRRRSPTIAKDACVLLLGGSNGILRQVAVQLVFAEGVPVHAVHYDSAKLQVGPHRAHAITSPAQEVDVDVAFRNEDATKPDVITQVVAEVAAKYRVVHLVNGIAAGATKRYERFGKALVKDLDVAFDPVRQTPDFSRWENVRKVGLVEVDIATPADIERTNKMMGTSTDPWADALAAAGLLGRGESIVAFADYDFEKDDLVYGMGPLAGAKILQRESMKRIGELYGAHTIRIWGREHPRRPAPHGGGRSPLPSSPRFVRRPWRAPCAPCRAHPRVLIEPLGRRRPLRPSLRARALGLHSAPQVRDRHVRERLAHRRSTIRRRYAELQLRNVLRRLLLRRGRDVAQRAIELLGAERRPDRLAECLRDAHIEKRVVARQPELALGVGFDAREAARLVERELGDLREPVPDRPRVLRGALLQALDVLGRAIERGFRGRRGQRRK